MEPWLEEHPAPIEVGCKQFYHCLLQLGLCLPSSCEQKKVRIVNINGLLFIIVLVIARVETTVGDIIDIEVTIMSIEPYVLDGGIPQK